VPVVPDVEKKTKPEFGSINSDMVMQDSFLVQLSSLYCDKDMNEFLFMSIIPSQKALKFEGEEGLEDSK
jgi:hypothetical protein